MTGINRALTANRIYAAESFAPEKPCIFLSHISVDKNAVRAIDKYLREKKDVDTYLDENDLDLQRADKENDPLKVTNLIEKGINTSTHLMCLVSQNTVNSWWVPYEIGFAKKSSKQIATLKLEKGEIYLPDFLKLGEILLGTKSLNQYVSDLRQNLTETSNLSFAMESYNLLDDYMDIGK